MNISPCGRGKESKLRTERLSSFTGSAELAGVSVGFLVRVTAPAPGCVLVGNPPTLAESNSHQSVCFLALRTVSRTWPQKPKKNGFFHSPLAAKLF